VSPQLKQARNFLDHCLKRMLDPGKSEVKHLQNTEVWAQAVVRWKQEVERLEREEGA
jgi:hypothetical protein